MERNYGGMKMKTDDFTDKMIKEMAEKAAREQKAFEYMMFWLRSPDGWQKKARKYLLVALKNQKGVSNEKAQNS